MPKRRKKERREALVDEAVVLRRDLLSVGIWIVISLAVAGGGAWVMHMFG